MLNYESIHELTSFKLTGIEKKELNGKPYWVRKIEIEAGQDGWKETSLFSDIGPEALMTVDEKAKAKEDGFADLQLERFNHFGEPSGIARIAGA